MPDRVDAPGRDATVGVPKKSAQNLADGHSTTCQNRYRLLDRFFRQINRDRQADDARRDGFGYRQGIASKLGIAGLGVAADTVPETKIDAGLCQRFLRSRRLGGRFRAVKHIVRGPARLGDDPAAEPRSLRRASIGLRRRKKGRPRLRPRIEHREPDGGVIFAHLAVEPRNQRLAAVEEAEIQRATAAQEQLVELQFGNCKNATPSWKKKCSSSRPRVALRSDFG